MLKLPHEPKVIHLTSGAKLNIYLSLCSRQRVRSAYGAKLSVSEAFLKGSNRNGLNLFCFILNCVNILHTYLANS